LRARLAPEGGAEGLGEEQRGDDGEQLDVAGVVERQVSDEAGAKRRFICGSRRQLQSST
jgi:hypothetical protein